MKEDLLYNTMCLINLTPFDRKRCIEEERRRVKERLLQRAKPKEFRSGGQSFLQKSSADPFLNFIWKLKILYTALIGKNLLDALQNTEDKVLELFILPVQVL